MDFFDRMDIPSVIQCLVSTNPSLSKGEELISEVPRFSAPDVLSESKTEDNDFQINPRSTLSTKIIAISYLSTAIQLDLQQIALRLKDQGVVLDRSSVRPL